MQTIRLRSPVSNWYKQWWFWIIVGAGLLSLLTFFIIRTKRRKQTIIAQQATTKASEEKSVHKETSTIETKTTPVKKQEKPLHLPALSFNQTWEVIPMLPTEEEPVRFRIFNEAGVAPVNVDLVIPSENNKAQWMVMAEGLKSILVPLADATQLRAVIASFLQQISPVSPQ